MHICRYDRSAIMRRAWVIFRTVYTPMVWGTFHNGRHGAFGQALREAWAEARITAHYATWTLEALVSARERLEGELARVSYLPLHMSASDADRRLTNELSPIIAELDRRAALTLPIAA